MSSTGEVGCLADDYSEALLLSMLATGYKIPSKDKAVMISSGEAKSKVQLLNAARQLYKSGYTIYASAGTARFLQDNDIQATPTLWPDEDAQSPNNVLTLIGQHRFDLVVNIPKNHTTRELTNGYRIRRAAIDHNVPLITNARLASAFINAFCTVPVDALPIKSWSEYE